MGRIRSSIFDKYYEQVEIVISEGHSYAETYRILFEDMPGYEYSSFMYFVRTRGLKKPYSDIGQSVPCKCSQCEECITISRKDYHHYKDIKACLRTKREVNHITAPRWCPKRRETNVK